MQSRKRMGVVHRVTLIMPGDVRTITARSGQHLWDAAQAAGIALPSLCRQGHCLSCAGRIVGPGKFDASDSVTYFGADRAAGFVLLCTAKARSDLLVQTHQQDEMRAHRLRLGLPAPYA